MDKIKALETQFNFTFSADYRSFLNDGPTGRLDSSDLMSRTGTAISPLPDMMEAVSCLYGIDFLGEHLKSEDGTVGFWHVNLLKHAYPVGKSSMGDPIVQVASGKNAGKIYMTNHEGWYGMFEHLALRNDEDVEEIVELLEDYIEDIDEETIRNLSTDAFIDILTMEERDGAVLLAENFDDFHETFRLFENEDD